MGRIHTQWLQALADFFPEYEYQPVPSGLLLPRKASEQKELL